MVLPTYPFERKRHWIDPVSVKRPVAPSLEVPATPVASGRDPVRETRTVVAATIDSRSRRDRLVAELKSLLNGMSGVDVTQLDEHATFLALGFDSLFLTQVTQALRRQYGVKITFRQLMEELRDHCRRGSATGRTDAGGRGGYGTRARRARRALA